MRTQHLLNLWTIQKSKLVFCPINRYRVLQMCSGQSCPEHICRSLFFAREDERETWRRRRKGLCPGREKTMREGLASRVSLRGTRKNLQNLRFYLQQRDCNVRLRFVEFMLFFTSPKTESRPPYCEKVRHFISFHFISRPDHYISFHFITRTFLMKSYPYKKPFSPQKQHPFFL